MKSRTLNRFQFVVCLLLVLSAARFFGVFEAEERALIRLEPPTYILEVPLPPVERAGTDFEPREVTIGGSRHIAKADFVGAIRGLPDGEFEESSIDNFFSSLVMLRACCIARTMFGDVRALGGHGGSRNAARRVADDSMGKGVYLLAQPGITFDWDHGPRMRLCLVNQSDTPLWFSACDSRLSIIQEALDLDGNWKPIEYLPRSWCGNSYHRVSLMAGWFWAFKAMRYKGSISTKLRFAMRMGPEDFVYSNEFDGSVNAEQFTVEAPYRPRGVMDPYAK